MILRPESGDDFDVSKDQLDAILKTLDTPVIVNNHAGKKVFANKAAARLMGFESPEELVRASREELLSKYEIVDEGMRPLPDQALPSRRALRGETVEGQIACYRIKQSGEVRWSVVKSSPILGDDGKIEFTITIFQDITALKRVEEIQTKHLRYLRRVDEISRAIDNVRDTERIVPMALEKTLAIMDCDRAWLVHKADADHGGYRVPFAALRDGAPEARDTHVLPPEACMEDVAAAVLAAGEPIIFGRSRPFPSSAFWERAFHASSMLTIMVRPQVGNPWIMCLLRSVGSVPWEDDDISLFKDIGARVSGILGSMLLYRDLHRSEENYRTLFERSLDGIYRCGPDGTVLETNAALMDILGMASRRELVGTVQKGLLPGGGEMAGLPDRSEVFTVELGRKDGTSVWVEVSSQAVRRASGEIAYFEGMVRNINDRKRTEEALKASEEKLRQSQKMEAVGRLAGGVAHDFNNLLTAINGFGDLLLMSVPKTDHRRGHVEEIRSAGARAAALTGQLLAFSRKSALSPQRLDVNAVVTGMESMLRRLIGENIQFKLHLGEGLAKVVSDPNQLEQVLLNLVVNARDAMPDGGELHITTANHRLGEKDIGAFIESPPGNYVMLSVRDTGVGMDDATKARLFEPFFTTKPKDKGTGLGLSTVYGAVKQSNGTLALESQPGKGTMFSIYFPALDDSAPLPEKKHRPSRPRPTERGTETILLVEDEDAVRRLVRDVLTNSGYTVLEASGGDRALEVAAAHPAPIHLLLTDVVMSGMSGRKLAEHMRVARPSTKVLFMSGYTEDAIIRHGVMTSKTAFLGKPFTPLSLGAKVREVLDGPSDQVPGTSGAAAA